MKKYAVSLMIIGSLMLGGCGDDKPMEETATIAIGGTVNGLDEIPGRFVEISLIASDGTESVKAYGNGAFSFDDKLEEGETYAVSISENPEEQVCTVTEGGSGEATGVNITNIVINCI